VLAHGERHGEEAPFQSACSPPWLIRTILG